jgi:pimeloyl-ACP methyl ester carboxylesterase
MNLRFLLPLACGGAVAHAAAADRPLSNPAPPIAWGPCGSELAHDADPSVAKIKAALATHLGDRLQCARMIVPLDHYHSDGPKISVGLIRARALDATRRKGAYFFHVGGPGGNPRDFILSIGAKWASADASDPIAGWQHQVSASYDLVAVVPRGLEGGDTFHCRGIESIEAPPDALDDWFATAQTAADIAYSCGANPSARWIGTEQYVFDLEQARRAMGEPVLNFVGYSYGGLAGAWHRAMFPTAAGRMLLDSSVDFTASIDEADLATLRERDREFHRRAVRPLLAQAAVFTVTDDKPAIMARLKAMPARARNAWLPLVNSPSSLRAVLALAPLVTNQPWITETEMRTALAGLTLGRDPATDLKVRKRADVLVGAYHGGDAVVIEAMDIADGEAETAHASTWPARRLGTRESVFLATRCNDNPWDGSITRWGEVARQRATDYPASRQGVEFFALVCSQWEGRVSSRPSLEPIHATSPFLLIHAEHDVRTPLDGASRILDRYAGARMVVARGVSGHGILAGSRTPCVEQAAGQYLLDGTLPDHRLSGCPYVARPKPPRKPREEMPASPRDVDELIEALRQDD